MITVEKYTNRSWGVYDADDLVCVTLYKRGAQEVARRLNEPRGPYPIPVASGVKKLKKLKS